ncbi:MAG: CAP domain-containing protein [Patescibacteria group bacterium]
MLKHLHNFFIPHEGNDHKPHALRPRALQWYAAVLVGLKIVATVVLFVSYPDIARLSQELNQEIVRLINNSRLQAKVSSLVADPELERAAQLKANDMLVRGYFDHVSPEGKKPWEFINAVKYPYQAVGENLAIDFVTSDAVHAALMASPPHYANIVQKAYQHVGVAVVNGPYEGRNTNILVELFAARVPLSRTATVKKGGERGRVAAKPMVVATNPSRVLSVVFPEVADEEKNDVEEAIAAAPPVVAPAQKLPSLSTVAWVYQLVIWTKRIYYASLLYLALALSLTIFIRIRVQHASVIAQTIVLMVVVAALAFTDWHVLERMTSVVKVL